MALTVWAAPWNRRDELPIHPDKAPTRDGEAAASTASPPQEVKEARPSSAEYDPVMAFQTGGHESEDIFAAEKRDPKWAGQYEAGIHAEIQKELTRIDLRDHVSKIDVECRRASCLVKVTVRKESTVALSSVYPIGLMGELTGYRLEDAARDDEDILVFYLHLSPRYRDFDTWEAWVVQRQQEFGRMWQEENNR